MQVETANSVIRVCGTNQSHCGYCDSSGDTKVSYGVISSQMSVHDYERLMLTGWRRAGTYFYKPRYQETCCPPYTIRLPISKFKMSKSQKQVSNRFERYLRTGDIHEKLQADLAVREHALSIETLEPACTPERYKLYKKYQIIVHNDSEEDISELQFKRFLIDSPLVDTTSSSVCRNTLPSPNSATLSSHNNTGQSSTSNQTNNALVTFGRYGTFHQLYRIDGELVAVGVIDVLPSGLSAVYMYYDPDYRFLILGKLTALQEINCCRENGLTNYYMGFYIHSCEKMRYKAEFCPSELLCPISFEWFDFESVCKPLLNRCSFTPFHPNYVAKHVSDCVDNYSGSESNDTTVAAAHSIQALSLNKCKMTNEAITVSQILSERYHGYVDVSNLQILLQSNRLVKMKQLTEESRLIVEPILQEWVEACTPEIAKNFVVKF